MGFIVRVLEEDVALWEEYQHELNTPRAYRDDSSRTGRVFYHLRQDVFHSELSVISLKSPARLESLVGQDLYLFIVIEDNYLSKSTGAGKRVLLRLERLNRALEGTLRRLRLRIERIDQRRGGHPRVILAQLVD